MLTGIAMGFLLAGFVLFVLSVGITKAFTWIFEIGVWILLFLFLFVLFTAGILLTMPFILSFIFFMGFMLLVGATIKGGNSKNDNK